VEEFLGILFAGGRGTRLGKITSFISKAFVPIYDRPVFMYGLAQLEASRHIREILIVTNAENDDQFRRAGYQTLIQDDAQVRDMLSGLRYARSCGYGGRHAVLVPCDNVSDVDVDGLIGALLGAEAEVCYGLRYIDDLAKASQMGVFDPATRKVVYRPPSPPSRLGMIAPYVVHRDFTWTSTGSDADVVNEANAVTVLYEGRWFDIGDPESLARCVCAVSGRSCSDNGKVQV
jgi:dTDP-glucose pyrophosphorylase